MMETKGNKEARAGWDLMSILSSVLAVLSKRMKLVCLFTAGYIGLILLMIIFAWMFTIYQSHEIQILKVACESTTYHDKAKACEELNKRIDEAFGNDLEFRAALAPDTK